MLVEPHVGRRDERAFAPLVALRLLALGPHEAEPLAAHHDHVRAGTVGMGFLVGAHRKLRDVAGHRAPRHVEADVAAPRAALLRRDERKVHRVGDEVGVEEEPFLLALVGEVVGLAAEAVAEVVLRVEHEVEVAEGVDDRRRVGDRDEARRFLARGVEVLVHGVERNREDRARLPLEGDLRARAVPYRGRAAAVEDIHHLLEQLALRSELAAGRDLAHVCVVRRARGVMVEEDSLAAAPRPRLQLHRVQVQLVDGALDVEPLGLHPARIRSLLLGGELLRHFVRHSCFIHH